MLIRAVGSNVKVVRPKCTWAVAKVLIGGVCGTLPRELRKF